MLLLFSSGVFMITFTFREFNQNVSKIQSAVLSGPVMITKRGTPSLVILRADDYRRLTEEKRSNSERLSMPADEYVDDFETPKLGADSFIRAAEF